jgi:molecular chaperone DnaK
VAYALGVDLGTTFTAAALCRDGRADMVSLGNRAASIPSLVFLREDDDVIVGDGAERRGLAEPERLAREFKRRIGDTSPILLGRTPYSAERLMAMLLRSVVATVTEREGTAPQSVALAHPANWSSYKTDLLRQAAEQAGVQHAMLISEPVAAAIEHAATERVMTGELVAVYDLGGGTFDAAVLRKTESGFEVVGTPQGIERLGGIDIDASVMAHVSSVLGGRLDGLDRRDPAVQAGLARLHAECVLAKEALSSDSDTTIVVTLPGVQQDVRLTRVELEGMIRPVLKETTLALRRSIDSVPASVGTVGSVLLVGGSSRIPLVADMVAAEVGKPVRLDAHPKHAIALGAARAAAVGFSVVPSPSTVTTGSPPAAKPVTSPPPPPPTSSLGTTPSRFGASDGPVTTAMERLDQLPTIQAAMSPAARSGQASGPRIAQQRSRWMVGAGVAAVLLAGAGLAFALKGNNSDAADSSVPKSTIVVTPDSLADDRAVTVPVSEVSPSSIDSGVTEPPTTQPECESESGLCVSIDSIKLDGDQYVAQYTTFGYDPLIFEEGVKGTAEDHHVHFFFDSVAAQDAGVNSPTPGAWVVWDRDSGGGTLRFDAYGPADSDDFSGTPAGQLCAAVATSGHEVFAETASCMALPS